MRELGSPARIVAVTGYGRETDRAHAIASGFDEHLVKPVSLARLDELVRTIPAS